MKIHRISIKNFAGVRALELSPRAGLLICGPNGAGKSSILDGLRAALTGDVARVKLKKEWREMISHGEKIGTVIVDHDGGRSAVTLQTGKHETDGSLPLELPVLLDANRFARMSDLERRAFIFALMELKATPTAIVDRMVKNHGADPALCKQVQPLLNSGFDAALAHAKEEVSQARGAWRAIAGEAYGTEKAKGWAPAPVESPSPEEIAALGVVVIDADEAAQRLAGEIGALEERTRQYEAQIERIKKLNQEAEELPHARTRLERAQGELEIWSKRLEELPPEPGAVDLRPPMACPDCGSLLTLRDGGLHQHSPAKADDDETATKRQQWKKCIDLQKSTIANAERAILAAERAKVELTDLVRVEPASGEAIQAQREAMNEARATARKAREALERAKAQRVNAENVAGLAPRAAEQHELAQRWETIAQALAPDGVRTAIVAEALDPLNAAIARNAAAAYWPVPQIGADMEIRVGSNSLRYSLLSESEQWRVDALITASIAELSGVGLFALDRMDVLDLKARGDLLFWLSDVITEGRIQQVIVAGTLKSKPAELPEHFEAAWIDREEIEEAEAA